MSVIKIDNLWEKYRIKFITEGRVSWEEVWALEDINVDIRSGEVVGIIGQNGAGKTTLLRLLAGMLVADKGEVAVFGRVSAIMDLGAGLNPEFTGRENIVLNARIYGISEKTLKQKIDEIIEFSNLGKFIDAPIKYYSQGMYMRLAFALAIFAQPDILLIDDILAVGDEEAQQKCRKKIVELKQAGKTIVLVSHDMGMVSKLCDRVLLLEKGRIVRTGLPGSVIPYYLDTAGNKSGIAFLEQQELRVVFNNGRLSISYSGNSLTTAAGGYASSFESLLKIHYPWTNLSWKITSLSAFEFTAEGVDREKSENLQSFRVTLHDNELNIFVNGSGSTVKQHNFNLFLIAAYDRWVILDKEGNFPAFSHRINWFDLGVNASPGQKIGLLADSNDALPKLILQTQTAGGILKFFNSGYEQESRIVHLVPAKTQNLSLNLKFHSCKKDFDDYLDQERRILFSRQQEEAAKKLEQEKLAKEEIWRMEQQEKAKQLEQERLAQEEARRKEQEAKDLYLSGHTISTGDYRLFVDTQSRCLRIYFKNQEITACGGLNSIFFLPDLPDSSWHAIQDLPEPCWVTRKLTQNELFLTLDFTWFKQHWSLAFKDNNVLTVKVVIELKTQVSIINRFVRLELSNKYDAWETSLEEGLFSDAQYINNISPVRLKDVRVCRIAVSSCEEKLPRLIFEVIGKNEQYVTGIFKQQQGNQEFSCISFCPTLPWSDKTLPAGKHDFFEGKIIFGLQEKLENKNNVESNIFIGAHEGLGFSFDRGRGNILLGEKMLSNGLGVYTALRSQNIWYDSTQAAWSCVEKDKRQMIIQGRWPYIPVAQVWKLEIISKNIIRWEAQMEIYAPVSIEIEQASVMLDKEYEKWLVGNLICGDFLDEFTRDYDILPFRYWYGMVDENGLAAIGNSVPKIIFTNTMFKQMSRGLVENSDYLYCSRILQYQRYNHEVLSAKKYPYFSGEIKIED